MRSTGARAADEIEPYHDRVRFAVLEHLAPDTLRAHHRRLATTLEVAPDDDPEGVALHWLGAGERVRASHYALLAAAQAAEALAFARATCLYGLAHDLADEAGRSRALAGLSELTDRLQP